MSSKVIIERAKNIKHLEFIVPSKQGVYLLVGPNGTGKTTLLTCLDRIGNPQAFARNFISSKFNTEIDRYKNAVITYEIDKPSIKLSYRKKNKRWAVSPKRGSAELSKFGFESTVFIQADAKRIDVPSDDIRQGNFTDASPSVKDGMNELFETRKYSKLKRLKNTYGRGRKAQFYYVFQEGEQYYSEKRFSTGELALLRLVERISDIQDHSMILLDEAEMALHPRIQKNLLDYLEKKASEKILTVIIATHSITMIKAVDKYHILMLDDLGKGKFEVVTPCYPAKAIGCVDFIENSIFDAIIFVEDEMAKLILEKMMRRCVISEPNYSTINTRIVPVGGYKETAMMALNTKDMLFNRSRVFAVWDADVFTETMVSNPDIKKLHDDNQNIIFNLGCTPELWMIDSLESGSSDLNKIIRDTFYIEVRSILNSEEYKNCNSSKPRKLAKARIDVVVDKLTGSSGCSKDIVLDRLTDMLIDKVYDEGTIKRIVMPILKRVR